MSILDTIKAQRNVIVNAIAMTVALLVSFGVLKVAPPTPDTIGVQFDEIVGGVTAVLALVNVVLHLFPQDATAADPSGKVIATAKADAKAAA